MPVNALDLNVATVADAQNTLEKGLAILIVLARAEAGLTLTEATRQTSVDKATLLRMLRALERWRFVQRDAQRRYRVGPSVFRLAHSVGEEARMRDVVRPALARLTALTGEASAFFVRVGDQRLCLAVTIGSHPISISTRVGDLYSLDHGAAGRVLLEHGAGASGGAPVTAAVSVGERDPELAGVAGPVFSFDGTLFGTISVAGPVARMTEAGRLDDIAGSVLAICTEASAQMRGEELDATKA